MTDRWLTAAAALENKIEPRQVIRRKTKEKTASVTLWVLLFSSLIFSLEMVIFVNAVWFFFFLVPVFLKGTSQESFIIQTNGELCCDVLCLRSPMDKQAIGVTGVFVFYFLSCLWVCVCVCVCVCVFPTNWKCEISFEEEHSSEEICDWNRKCKCVHCLVEARLVKTGTC